MNTAIWKFKLEVADADAQRLYMPKGSIILSTAMQNTDLCIWALVDTHETEQEEVFIEVYGTGNPITNTMKPKAFIGTAVAGRFVWHVFMVKKPEIGGGMR
jgi:hypothetical protein